jgi:YD repeat-containing protein
MQCPSCRVQIPEQPGSCPNCGFHTLKQAPRPSLGSRKPGRLIIFCVLCVVLIALVVQRLAIPAFHELQASRAAAQEAPNEPPRVEVRSSRYAVEHGHVAYPEELHGHGKLYFVPVGRQAIFVRSLAEYYANKFGIQIYLLPEVKLAPSACVPERNQCIAEEVIGAMASAYSDIARNPESVMIALTDEDIFPKEFGWDFTYSLHSSRLGVVSTRRMDPAFWGDRPDNALRLASTKQMLTKYIAIQYFHLPESFDPTSNMFSPLTPNGGSDDIYESDLHSEASANGLRGMPFPCLHFTYSYATHEVRQEEPVVSECKYVNHAESTDEETFETNLGGGQLAQRSMDIQLNSTPPIELRRGYNSGYAIVRTFAFGWSANHSYNPGLTSDDEISLKFLSILREDGATDFFARNPSGRGFDPAAVYVSRDYGTYGAQLTWEKNHFKLNYRDGSWSTFLPCSATTRCYWSGYEDSHGSSLKFDRGPHQELLQLTASDSQGISFRADDHQRTTEARATNGTVVFYEYDSAGCLARVHRADGQETLYEYDPAHHMTSMSVISSPGAAQEAVLRNEYDSRGRVITQTLKGIGSFHIEYVATNGTYNTQVKVTTSLGDVLDIRIGTDLYVARSQHVQYAAAARP